MFSLKFSNYLRIEGGSQSSRGTSSTALNLSDIITERDVTLFAGKSIFDDFSRFTWVFFLGTKDETYDILNDFITFVENQLTTEVKTIRCDNGTEFKNSKLIELYGSKGIRRDYSNARTPQQNGVAERKNRTLIEAARTMFADSKLPTMFWTEAVSTTCYVLNRVLVTKPHNKAPYELVSGKGPNISHLKPFGCLVTILNTSDYLGKFEGKADEGFIVGYAAGRLEDLSRAGPTKTQKNRMAQVQEAAKYYTEEDWDLVRAKLKANRDLSSKVLSIDFSSGDFAKKMVEIINEKKRL
ncbi:putative ribonuclease H-like domain-containing protein [Tanacetum coccineum]